MVKVGSDELKSLEVFNEWGKTTVEINVLSYVLLHIEGPIDRFTIKVYPNGKSLFNRDFYRRCFKDTTSVEMYRLMDVISTVFETECIEI